MLLLHRLGSFSPSFFYKAGVDIDHSFLLGKTLLVSPMNERYARDNYKGRVEVIEKLSKFLEKRRVKKLEMELSTLPSSIYLKLRKRFRISDASKRLLKERELKSDEEARKIANAAKIAQEALSEIDVCKFRTEKELENAVKRAIEEKGAEVSFIIVASGASTAFPHYKARDVPLKDPVVVDVGARVGYYTSDITETFTKRAEVKEIRKKLKEMVGMAEGARTTEGLNAFLKRAYKRDKLPLPPHLFGHGIGLDVHELPSFRRNTTLKGKAFAVEPAVYLKDYGVRYERNFIGKGKRNIML
ncbi:MAG: M24 family metallopeptidase [Candidatus Anstonellales archaeon]